MSELGDLRIPPGPGAPRGLTVPAAELLERFSRSSGPGGQGVNTTDSRVQLSLDIGATSALDEAQRARALIALSGRLVGTVLTVDASEHRSQRHNRVAARTRLAEVLGRALRPPPPPRRPTSPSRGAQMRRLADKRQRGATKAGRARPRDDD